MAIPKIIHYCWFGEKEFPALGRRCLASWKKFLPDYRIVLWNELNFDLSAFCFTREAAAMKKWAFVSDFLRLYALYRRGGVYLDSDVEVLKPLDGFLRHRAFTGFERPGCPVTGIMGAEAGHPWIKGLLADYSRKHFIDESGVPDLTPNTELITRDLRKRYGVLLNNRKQFLDDGLCIYPQEIFCPLTLKGENYGKNFAGAFTVHWFAGSWRPPGARLLSGLGRVLRKIHLYDVARRIVRGKDA